MIFSMFGNLDNVQRTRSMVTVVANRAVDLLYIKTEKFYEVLKSHQTILSKLQKCMLLENLASKLRF